MFSWFTRLTKAFRRSEGRPFVGASVPSTKNPFENTYPMCNWHPRRIRAFPVVYVRSFCDTSCNSSRSKPSRFSPERKAPILDQPRFSASSIIFTSERDSLSPSFSESTCERASVIWLIGSKSLIYSSLPHSQVSPWCFYQYIGIPGPRIAAWKSSIGATSARSSDSTDPRGRLL